MGLLTQVMGAIQDPNCQASMGQMGQIFQAAKQLSQSNNTDSATMQQVASVVGGYVRSALQEKRNQDGTAAAQAVVRQGSTDGMAALAALFSQSQQQQLAQAVSAKTGIDANQVLALLPMLIPLVMQLLNQGEAKGSAGTATAASPAAGNNPILAAFLDGDGDGDVDLGDMIGMASKFM